LADNSGIFEELHAERQELERMLKTAKNIITEEIVLSASPFFSLEEKEGKLLITGIALAEGVWKSVLYPAEEIEKSAFRLVGKPLKIEHGLDALFEQREVGKVKVAYYDKALKSIVFQAEVTDSEAIALVKDGTFPAVSCFAKGTKIFSKFDISNIEDDPHALGRGLKETVILKIRFLPDLEYFEGITVESKEDLNQVIYHFKPIKEGSAEIRVSYELSGSPIGASPVFKYQISISPISFGTKMKFHFFPPLAELKEGDIVSVLVKDNQSDYILGAVNLYLNGIKMEGNSFIVEQGKSYTLSASLTGYSPLEEIIKIENPDIILYLSKATPDVGDIITVIPTPQNLTIYLELNGTSINNNFIINNAGTYTVTATASGYKKTNITFDVIDKLVVLTTIPEKVKLGQKLIIELSREAPWSLTYRANNKTDTYPETIYSSTSQVINLEIPNKKGLYFFYVDGSELIVWDNRGMSFNWKWILVILAIIGILIFGSKLIKPKGPRRFAGLSSQGENIVETIR